MRYINLTSHEKLLRYSDNLKSNQAAEETSEGDMQDNLFKNIDQLNELVKKYKKAISSLQNFSDEYESIHKKVRSGLRKLRMVSVRKINRQY